MKYSIAFNDAASDAANKYNADFQRDIDGDGGSRTNFNEFYFDPHSHP